MQGFQNFVNVSNGCDITPYDKNYYFPASL